MVEKLQHWLLNSNLGTAIILGLIGFTVNTTLEYMKLKDRINDMETSHILFHYYDKNDNCLVIEHNNNYFCVKIDDNKITN